MTYTPINITTVMIQLAIPRANLFLPMLSHKINDGAGGSII